jgi:hypothetical protein
MLVDDSEHQIVKKRAKKASLSNYLRKREGFEPLKRGASKKARKNK